MTQGRTVVFVCLHGAAKSVIAAAYFRRLAAERGLPLTATAAGTEPDPDVAPGVAAGLHAQRIEVRGDRPRRVTRDELAVACRVVSLGADLRALAELAPPRVPIDRWDDVPAVSEGFDRASGAIAARVSGLLDEMARADTGR